MPAPTGSGELASVLATADRSRMVHRAQRMESVVEELQRRARLHAQRHGTVPRPLGLAIRDFRTELRELHRRLAADKRA